MNLDEAVQLGDMAAVLRLVPLMRTRAQRELAALAVRQLMRLPRGSAVRKVRGISESGPEPGDAARVIVAPELLRRVRKDISGAGGTMTGAAVSTPTAGGGLRRRRRRGV